MEYCVRFVEGPNALPENGCLVGYFVSLSVNEVYVVVEG
jgi:hypothetical protein